LPALNRRCSAYKDASVWHCSLSLRAEEGALTDQQWGDIANDFVDSMGFRGVRLLPWGLLHAVGLFSLL
jgi:hypothetical protein